MTFNVDSISDFVKGQEDCINGVDHKSGKSESYDKGYNYQYQLEQVMSELSK